MPASVPVRLERGKDRARGTRPTRCATVSRRARGRGAASHVCLSARSAFDFNDASSSHPFVKGIRTMRQLGTLVLLAGLLASNGRAAAQQAPLELWGGLDVFTASLTVDAAEAQGTADRMWGGQFSFGAIGGRVLGVGADMGFVGLRDHRSFSEPTTGGDKTSTVGGVMGSLLAGLYTPPLALAPGGAADVRVGVNVGYTLIGADRSINECLDCTIESVRIHAGRFWEPGIQVFHGKGGISARYRRYGSGSDVRDALMIGYTLRASPRGPRPIPEPAAQP